MSWSCSKRAKEIHCMWDGCSALLGTLEAHLHNKGSRELHDGLSLLFQKTFILETAISYTPCSTWTTFKPLTSDRALHPPRCNFHPPHVGKHKTPTPRVILRVFCVFGIENTVICVARGPHGCQEESSQPSPSARRDAMCLLTTEADRSHVLKTTVIVCRAAW